MFANRMNWMLALVIAVCIAGAMEVDAIAEEREIISFRLPQWKSAHFDDAESARTNYETFKLIGCESEQHQHGGHFDVRYRCVDWRSITLTSHEEAHQWQRWLNAYGFETSHRH